MLSQTLLKQRAILLTDGLLATSDAKTAHGLIRGSERYVVVGVVDAAHAGRDAGEVLDGQVRHIPIFATPAEALANLPALDCAIVGVATVGGVLPPGLVAQLADCLRAGLSAVSGLHEWLSEKPELVALANRYGGQLTDVRRPKPHAELHFWTGEVFQITAPIVAVLGTDCALGKRTTTRLLREACERRGLNAQMIYTGQTGWLQGGQYGFVLDATLNDFVAGELEHALLTCWRETAADVLLIEGQAALRNPSGPCGSEFLVSGGARHVVLVHAPKRRYYDHVAAWGPIPALESEIALIRQYGAAVLAVALNTEDCSPDESRAFRAQYEAELGLPVVLPLEEGMDRLVPLLQTLLPVPARP